MTMVPVVFQTEYFFQKFNPIQVNIYLLHSGYLNQQMVEIGQKCKVKRASKNPMDEFFLYHRVLVLVLMPNDI